MGILTTLAEAGGGRHFFLILWVLADANGRDKRWTELLGYPKSLHTTWICVFFCDFLPIGIPWDEKKTSRPTIWGKIFGSLFQKIMASREWIQVFLAHFFRLYIYIHIYYTYIYTQLAFPTNFPRSQYHNFQCSPALPLTSPSKPCLFFLIREFHRASDSPTSPQTEPVAFKRNQAYLTQGILGRALGHAQDALELARSGGKLVDRPCSYCLFFWGMKAESQPNLGGFFK